MSSGAVSRAPLGVGEGAWARRGLVAAAALVAAVLLLMPLAVLVAGAFASGVGAFLLAVSDPDAAAAIRLTLLVAALVVPINTAFGLLAAWCVTRYRFAGRGLMAVLLALPFSVSPVVAGLVYVLLFGRQGWFGPALSDFGVRIVFALPGIVLATLFVTLPFVAGQLIPLMRSQGTAEEEAALLLGATGPQIFRRVTLPKVRWALSYGVLLCAARSIGEFGAVSVVSGHIRGLTDTMPLHIEVLYQEYNLSGAFAVALLLACFAAATVAVRAVLEWRQAAAERAGAGARLLAPA